MPTITVLHPARLLAFSLLFLLIVASRTTRIDSFILDNDEIWAIWQTWGTPTQIIQWTSPTEAPAYFLLLAGWRELVGMHPDMLRTLSLLGFLLGCACMYRAARRLYGEAAGWLALLAYAALGINLFLSLYTRSYTFVVAGLPLALWLTVRYFHRPTVRRALPLALSLLLLYFGSITSVPAFVLLGVFTLVAYRRQVWRWWLPGGLALPLALPDIVLNKLGYTAQHVSVTRPPIDAPLPQAVYEFFQYLTSGSLPPYLWIGLVLVAGVLLIARGRADAAPRYWLLSLAVVPVILYWLEPVLGYYYLKRYAWWYALGVALVVGVGLSLLPRAGKYSMGLLLAGLMFLPLRLNDFGYIATPVRDNLRWLSEHYRAGDVLVLDPNLLCNFPEEWEYYTTLYFPNDLMFTPEPEGYRRVWYAHSIERSEPELNEKVERGRLPGRFVGPPDCFLRLYEAPRDEGGILFENGMRFHGADVLKDDLISTTPAVRRERETVTVRLWWSVDTPVALDYSIGLYLLNDAGGLVDQIDGAPTRFYAPADAPSQTSQWQPGQFYVEERTLQLPALSARRRFSIKLVVYWFETGERFSANGVDDAGLLPLTEVAAVAW